MAIVSITFRNYRSIPAAGVTLPLTHEFLGLIGLNNSGKTSLLRAFYELNQTFTNLGSFQPGHGNLQNFFGSNGAGMFGPRLAPGERITPNYDELLEPRVSINFEVPQNDPTAIEQIDIIFTKQNGMVRGEITFAGGVQLGSLRNVSGVSTGTGGNLLQGTSSVTGETVKIDWEPIRSEFAVLANSMYVGPFRNAINSGGAAYYDISIGRDFITQFDDFKTGVNPRNNEAIRHMCAELCTIFGLKSLEISPNPAKDQLVITVDDLSHRGSELGSGISQFVILASNILVKRPSYLLIDEPELNLHASLQLRLLSLLAQNVERSVIFATHSLGLARSASDQLLVVSRGAKLETSAAAYQAIPSLSSTLGELGYGGLHDSAYKAVLLVEGASDVRTFQQLLAKYGVRNQVVIVPLGGDDLAAGDHGQELAELRRLSETIFAVVDSERTTKGGGAAKRREVFRQACEAQGIQCHILERRATENYLDQDVARSVLNCPNARSFEDFDKPGPEWNWSKERNWRIAMDMKIEDIEQTDLGPVLTRISEASR